MQGQVKWPEDELLTRRMFEVVLLMHGVSRHDIKGMTVAEVVEYSSIINYMVSGD